MDQPRTLEELRELLKTSINNDVAFGFITARVLIRVGVNLKQIADEQNRNPEVIAKVTDALGRMDIKWEGTQ
jgi:3-hydroxyacyl-CoA dehydrogenase